MVEKATTFREDDRPVVLAHDDREGHACGRWIDLEEGDDPGDEALELGRRVVEPQTDAFSEPNPVA